MARTLLDKVWESHTVRTLPSGQTQLLIGLHLIHEVTTPQAFQMLKDGKLKVRASLAVMERDASRMRGARPFVFTNVRAGDGVDAVAEFIEERGGLARKRTCA